MDGWDGWMGWMRGFLASQWRFNMQGGRGDACFAARAHVYLRGDVVAEGMGTGVKGNVNVNVNRTPTRTEGTHVRWNLHRRGA